MKNYIQRLWQDRSNDVNWQTEPDLHTKVEFKIFADMVLDTSKEILETLDYACRRYCNY